MGLLQLVWGGAHAPRTERLLRDIVACAKVSPFAKQILLVPEPFSHETERLLCAEGGDSIGLSCEVLTFKRIAHRVLVSEGGLAAPQLDQGGRILLLSRALQMVRPQLSSWGQRVTGVPFLEQLLLTLDELICHEARPEHLSLLPSDHPSAPKLCDLRLIWEAYDALVAQTARDPRDRFSLVADLLETGSLAVDCTLYVDGFVSFTAQEYRILRAFLRHGVQVVVALIGLPNDTQPHWEQAQKAGSRLRRLAEQTGCEITEVVLSSEATVRPHGLRAVEQYVWHEDTAPPQADGVQLVTAPDVLTECEWAAKLVASWVQDEGLRYRDIAIATPAWDEYRSMLALACYRHGLPVFSDEPVPVAHKAVVRFINASLDAILHSFEPDSVVELIHTGLLPITPDDGYLLEDYIRVHNVKGAHWTLDKPWTAHPAGWGNRPVTQRDAARLQTLNELRLRLRAPLLKLRTVFQKANSFETLARVLYQYCLDSGLAASLEAQYHRLEEQQLPQQAEECRQLWGLVCDCLDSCVALMGSEQIAPEEFGQLFALCLSQYKVGVIPVTLDSLHIGPTDRLRRRSLKRLIMVGVAEPYAPRRSESSGFLTDEERILLESSGISLAPDAEERASRELFTLYNCLALPQEQLVVSYAASVGSAQVAPSLVWERVRRITGLSPLLLTVPAPHQRGTPWYSDRTSLHQQHTGQLLSTQGSLSASRIEQYNSCQFAYFVKYGLQARLRATPGPMAVDTGNLIHAVLETLVKEVQTRGGFKTVPKDEALTIARDAAKAWIALLPDAERRTARIARLLTRLQKTVVLIAENVYDELQASDFQPLATELSVRTTSGDLPLTGVVDRVDGWLSDNRLYLRVIDYKSGRTRFSLRDVWYGLGIQMLCYLFAMPSTWEGHEVVPSGVLYLPAHDRFADTARGMDDQEITQKLYALLRRNGVLLDDPQVIDAMESGTQKRFLPVHYKKDGTPDAHAQLASAARFGKLRTHVDAIMQTLADEIRQGAVKAHPVSRSLNERTCDYCDAKQACLYNEAVDKPRLLASLSDHTFWETLEGQDDEH